MTICHARRPSARAGFTLMEMAIVLGTIGLIMSAIWTAATSAGNARKNNDAVNELQTVSQNMIALFSGQPFTGFTSSQNITASMITAQTIPSNYVNTTVTPQIVTTPWTGGSLAIYANTASVRNYRISFYGVPYAGCLALISQAVACQSGQLGCPVTVVTAGGGFTAAASGMNMSGAQTACKANGATNSVEFDYSI